MPKHDTPGLRNESDGKNGVVRHTLSTYGKDIQSLSPKRFPRQCDAFTGRILRKHAFRVREANLIRRYEGGARYFRPIVSPPACWLNRGVVDCSEHLERRRV